MLYFNNYLDIFYIFEIFWFHLSWTTFHCILLRCLNIKWIKIRRERHDVLLRNVTFDGCIFYLLVLLPTSTGFLKETFFLLDQNPEVPLYLQLSISWNFISCSSPGGSVFTETGGTFGKVTRRRRRSSGSSIWSTAAICLLTADCRVCCEIQSLQKRQRQLTQLNENTAVDIGD